MTRFRWSIVSVCTVVACASIAQEAPPAARAETVAPQAEGQRRVEGEFVASSVFRGGELTVRVVRSLWAEGYYFGTPEVNAGITGASWRFQWKNFAISPGIGVGFGSHVTTSPVFVVRWTLDTKRWFSQGLWVQDLSPQTIRFEDGTERRARSAILDNNHFSARIWRLEVGPLWEHIKFREEDEWKAGVRVAARLNPRIKVIFQAVVPEREFRGGIAFER